jgi:cell division topological specificity factor
LFRFLRPVSSAPVARERLQILLEYERKMVSQTDLIAVLREEILAVVSRHVTVDPDKAKVWVDRGQRVSMLVVGMEIPNRASATPYLWTLRRQHCAVPMTARMATPVASKSVGLAASQRPGDDELDGQAAELKAAARPASGTKPRSEFRRASIDWSQRGQRNDFNSLDVILRIEAKSNRNWPAERVGLGSSLNASGQIHYALYDGWEQIPFVDRGESISKRTITGQ